MAGWVSVLIRDLMTRLVKKSKTKKKNIYDAWTNSYAFILPYVKFKIYLFHVCGVKS